uniref:Rab-like protein 3 n=2 Tax=Cacopsylla melanoneura TaxID=428564 RepID=A0A8D8WQI5_9HEMI
MAALDKVRILVLGDSGVGKTCLTHLICHNECFTASSSTIGCTVDVKLHEYKEGTPDQKTFFIELWDIGGRPAYANTRHIFYNSVDGIILVHDLTNRKSQENLSKWLLEVVNRQSEFDASQDDFDPESFVGASKIPLLVMGTKCDLVRDATSQRRVSSLADECGAEEIVLNALGVKALAAGTGAAVKMSRFFDKVIQVKFYSGKGACFLLGRIVL